jgi:hypothetical protein
VTIIAAIHCLQGIVIAADSRTTNEDGTIRDDALKLHTLDCENSYSAILAHSGNAEVGPRIGEIMKQECLNRPEIKDYRGFAEMAERASAQLKDTIRRQFCGTATELQKHFEDHCTELLIASLYGDKPTVFTLNFSLGFATLRPENPVCIGCGSPIAGFLFDSFNLASMDGITAMCCAMYVVDRVKVFDPRCGGPTRLSLVNKVSRVSNEIGWETLNKLQAAVTRGMAGVKAESQKKVDAIFNDVIMAELTSRGVSID